MSSDCAAVRRRYALRLGYAGLIPFIALSVLCLLSAGKLQQQATEALIAYGAVIISFLGAWHWSMAIHGTGRDAALARMLYAVSPALMGWSAMLLPQSYGLVLIIAGLLITVIADRHWQVTFSWYLTLRRRLTFIATISVALALVSMLR
jgi:uncharacterized membrane protein YidH (DUF202 family)